MAKKISAEEAFAREVMFSKLPARPADRVLGWFDNFNLAVAANICTWLFVTGAWVGMLVPVPIAILLSVAAVAIPMIWICVIAAFSARTGLDQGIHARMTWGVLGGAILLLAMIPIFWGWASIPTVMFGRVTSQIFDYFKVSGWWTSTYLWAAVCLAIGFWLTYGGPTWQKLAFNIAAPTMILLIIAVTARTILQYGWGNIMAAKPDLFVQNPWQSMLIAFELNIGIGVSWLLNQSQWGRLCKTERAAFWPNFISWGVLWGLFSIPGILVGSVAGMSDPVQAMTLVGGTWAILYLFLLLLANPSSLVLELYFISLTVRTIFSKLSWIGALMVSFIPTLALTYLPGAYDQYQKFVTLIASIFMPIAAVWVLDILLHRMKINMVEAFNTSRKGAYYYWLGINWLAFISAAVGIGLSFLIYNPLTVEVHIGPIFNAVGASVVAAFVSGIIYYTLYRLILVRKSFSVSRQVPDLEK